MANHKKFPRSELCRRRGITISPIITQFVHEAIKDDSIEIHKNSVANVGQDKERKNSKAYYEEVSRWSSSSTESSSAYSQDEGETEVDYQESYAERLERYRDFFTVRPLMRCLDTDEDKLLEELLFARLLMEVQQAFGAPDHSSTSDFKGELESRSFWDDVRVQLRVDDDFLET